MIKRILILVVLALSGCSQSGENIGPYYISPFPDEGRLLKEAAKRDSLQLEDLAIGTGPVAARGRRLTADVEVRYTDGTVVYRGTILSFPGFVDLVGNIRDSKLLSTTQEGIDLGLNGMAVGGRRRMTIDRKLVCTDIIEGDPIRTKCQLIGSTFKDEVIVRKQNLIVEATLTESCNPVITWQGLYIFGDYMIKLQACREEPLPQITPGDPIWHYY
jgi:hypothetical protein